MISKIMMVLLGIFFISGASNIKKSEKLIGTAEYYLNHAEISYVWGGNTVGSKSVCESCTKCLNAKKPSKAKRLRLALNVKSAVLIAVISYYMYLKTQV